MARAARRFEISTTGQGTTATFALRLKLSAKESQKVLAPNEINDRAVQKFIQFRS